MKNTKGYNEEFLIDEVNHIHQGKTSFEIALMNTGQYGVIQVKLESWLGRILTHAIINNCKTKTEKNTSLGNNQITYFEVQINNETFIVEQWLNLDKYTNLDVSAYKGDYFIYRPHKDDKIF